MRGRSDLDYRGKAAVIACVGVLTDAVLGNQCPCGGTTIHHKDITYQRFNYY